MSSPTHRQSSRWSPPRPSASSTQTGDRAQRCIACLARPTTVTPGRCAQRWSVRRRACANQCCSSAAPAIGGTRWWPPRRRPGYPRRCRPRGGDIPQRPPVSTVAPRALRRTRQTGGSAASPTRRVPREQTQRRHRRHRRHALSPRLNAYHHSHPCGRMPKALTGRSDVGADASEGAARRLSQGAAGARILRPQPRSGAARPRRDPHP